MEGFSARDEGRNPIFDTVGEKKKENTHTHAQKRGALVFKITY